MPNINTTLPAVNGGADYAPLVGKADIFPFENGKRTSDARIGVKLNLALQGNRLSPLSVRFDSDPLPAVTDGQITETCSTCSFMYVQIPDCAVELYSGKNGLGMSATAKIAKIVTLNSGK